MKPTLFNTEMVQAILEDRKTVTRRCVKHEIHVFEKNGETLVYDHRFLFDFALDAYIDSQARYKKGDVLYVRETWGDYDGEASYYLYKADYTEGQKGFWFEKEQIHWVELPKWKPSIHMPKEAARLFLRITDVRIERLQSISGNDCFREGALTLKTYHNFDGDMMQSCVPYDFFADVWNSTLKKNELEQYGWDANPYVWVYKFEVISKEEAMKESEEE
ncbi:hypothetical protein MKC94_02960 [[Clostridium] innocuum]|nr:hypothetical protein [[Clostridium] innocuum]